MLERPVHQFDISMRFALRDLSGCPCTPSKAVDRLDRNETTALEGHRTDETQYPDARLATTDQRGRCASDRNRVRIVWRLVEREKREQIRDLLGSELFL